jgi:hypothetical protein
VGAVTNETRESGRKTACQTQLLTGPESQMTYALGWD